jgi:hypothetical protein
MAGEGSFRETAGLLFHQGLVLEVVDLHRTFDVVQGRGRRRYESLVSIDGVAQKSAIEFSIKAADQLAAERTYKALVSQGTIVDKPA